jgi:hypothetical protein
MAYTPLSPVEAARHDNPDPLIARLRSGNTPTPAEIEFFIELLEAKCKHHHTRLHLIEQHLIAEQVCELTKMLGKQEAAIERVMELHNCSRRKVFNALKARKTGRLSRI